MFENPRVFEKPKEKENERKKEKKMEKEMVKAVRDWDLVRAPREIPHNNKSPLLGGL